MKLLCVTMMTCYVYQKYFYRVTFFSLKINCILASWLFYFLLKIIKYTMSSNLYIYNSKLYYFSNSFAGLFIMNLFTESLRIVYNTYRTPLPQLTIYILNIKIFQNWENISTVDEDTIYWIVAQLVSKSGFTTIEEKIENFGRHRRLCPISLIYFNDNIYLKKLIRHLFAVAINKL